VTTATDLPDLGSLRQEQARLREELARLRRRLRRQLGLEFAVDVVASSTTVAVVLVFLDWWYRLALPARGLMLTLSVTAAGVVVGARAIRRWRAAGLDDLSLAITVDQFRPGTGQRIADVLQLPDQLNEPSSSVSPSMVRLSVRQASEALAASDWRSLWNRKRTFAYAAVLLAALLVPVAFAWLAPQAAWLSVARWLLESNQRWPQRTYLTVVGLDARGRIIAPRDERVFVEVRSDLPDIKSEHGRWVVHGRGEPLAFARKPTSTTPASVTLHERTGEGQSRETLMVELGKGRFRHEFPPTSTSSTFELIGGDDWLGPLKLVRVDRPSLDGIKLAVREPGASPGSVRTVVDPRQHLVFLPDSEIELTLKGSEAISDLRLNVQPGKPPDLKRLDARTFVAHWTLREATTLEILLTSATTGLTSKPAFLSIGLLKDREPRVTLRVVGVGVHVTPVATIPLTIGATDDFGMSALRLQIDRSTLSGEEKSASKTERQTVSIPLASEPGRPVLDHQVRHDLILQTDPPKVGTLLRLVAEADDQCARGVQTGRSSAVQMQVVSPDELFYEILIRQRSERAKFITVLETVERQTPILATTPAVTDYLKVMRVMHAGGGQMDQIAARIADTLQEMTLNQIGSPKSHRLLREGVVEPIRALQAGAGPMNELRAALQSLAGAGPRTGADQATAQRLHGEIVVKMKNILDQMSQWESFVDVVNQVAEVIKMQQKVLQATEKARESRTTEIFDAKPKP
jgi:hypothetical protein